MPSGEGWRAVPPWQATRAWNDSRIAAATLSLEAAREAALGESFDVGSLVEEFRDEAGDQVDRLDAGLLELEREGALEPGTRSDLLRTLHTLKGNAGMLGFAPVRDYVHALENLLKAEPGDWPPGTLERLFDGAAALRRAVEAAGRPTEAEAFAALTTARRGLEDLDTAADAAAEPAPREGADAAREGTDRVRVPFAKLDDLLNAVGELLGESDALAAVLGGREPDIAQARERAEALRRGATRLRETALSLRLVPVARVLGRFPGLVRRVAREQGKEARLVLRGEETEVDKSTADALAEPLLHLVRNAVDHGIEPPEVRERAGKPRHGTISIRARQRGDRVLLDIEDDGAGLALEAIRARAREAGLLPSGGEDLTAEEVASLIFRPGFSTRTEVSTLSGRGLGLDVVWRSVRALRGALTVTPRPEGGTRFRIALPLTVAIVPSVVFRAAGELLALPVSAVERTLRLDRIERAGPAEVVRAGDELVPLARLARLFGWPPSEREGFALVVRAAGRAAAVTAEHLLDERDLVVKALPSYGGRCRGVSGASVVPGGGVILLLDPVDLIELNVNGRRIPA